MSPPCYNCLMAAGVVIASLLVTPLVAGQTSTAADEPPPEKPCSAPEHRQFDFWIGTWEVFTPSGKRAGTNTIEPILGGCVLRESWRSAGKSGTIGHSFNIYRRGKWHQTWVDDRGLLLELEGGLDADGRMVMRQATTDEEGKPLMHEIRWTKKSEDEVVQHWRTSKDGGKTWSDLFRGTYRRSE